MKILLANQDFPQAVRGGAHDSIRQVLLHLRVGVHVDVDAVGAMEKVLPRQPAFAVVVDLVVHGGLYPQDRTPERESVHGRHA